MLGYVKAPPDMAYIISGMKKKSKVVIGKASIRIPFFERLDKLNLRLIPIDVKTSNAVPTADYININVDATVNVKISNDSEKSCSRKLPEQKHRVYCKRCKRSTRRKRARNRWKDAS